MILWLMVLVNVIQAELEGRHSQAGAWEREIKIQFIFSSPLPNPCPSGLKS